MDARPAAVATLDWQLHPLPPAQGLGPHRGAWDDLHRRLADGHPLRDGAFVDGLLRHFGDQGALLASARHQGEAVAMLLLEPHARGQGVWSGFLPPQTQAGLGLMPSGLDLRGLLAALPGSASELALPGPAVRSQPRGLAMAIGLQGGFDGYWARRPEALLRDMDRQEAALGGARLDIADEPEAIAAAVVRHAALQRRLRAPEGRSGGAQERFDAEVMAAFAARGEALVYELWLGDALLASRLVLSPRGGTALMLKASFDERVEHLAPGRVLLKRMLADLFQRLPGGTVEFYAEAGADLLAWSTAQHRIHHVSLRRIGSLPPTRRQSPPEAAGAGVERFGHVRELPADALALLAQAEQRHIEFGADWYANLADTVYAGHDLRWQVLRRQGRVLAVLPTVAQTTALGREVGALANFYTALFAPALAEGVEAGDLLPLTRALRQDGAGAAAYRFAPMDPAAREFAVLAQALRLAGLKVCRYFAFGNWYEPVCQGWADYLKARSGQLRSTLRRNAKKFAAEGGRLEIVQGGDGLAAALAAYQAVYAHSWKVPEPYPEFMPGLVRLCARRGWLRLGLAWLGDKPVAAQIWIVANGRADIYKLAYDESHKALAPGTLLTAHLMAHALDVDRVREVDYLIGDDPYKATWMSQRRERWGLVAYDALTLRGLAGLAGQTFGEAWRRLQSRPAARTRNS
ncbi:MAG: GNAT family N-acetyltransferase [Roseateles sp.]|uniref:GNAT family N-acetyltransferase n=1 Tax=Roseateles sp. TaxID=1971397 RepID=UPI0039EBD92E